MGALGGRAGGSDLRGELRGSRAGLRCRRARLLDGSRGLLRRGLDAAKGRDRGIGAWRGDVQTELIRHTYSRMRLIVSSASSAHTPCR